MLSPRQIFEDNIRPADLLLKVFRLLRTQVSFTSTLPRKGYAIVCPECDGLISADLSGLL